MSKQHVFIRRTVFAVTAAILVGGGAVGGVSAAPAVSDGESFQVAQLFGSSKKRSKEAAELNLRVDGVEQEIRNITGKLEELSFQLQQLQDQLRRMQEDNEFRFQELEKRGGSKRGSVQPSNNSRALAKRGNTNQDTSSGVLGQVPRNFADVGVSTGQSSGPLDLSALTQGNATGYQSGDEPPAATTETTLSVGEPGQDYEAAYNRVLQGDYTGSEKMFRTFLASYPNHHLAGNAQYWLGESLFARGLYRDAADAFLKSYSEYPGSTKGPDSLLKLGLALAGLGETAAACATYGELLTKYPQAPTSVKKRASVESNIIGCAS